MRNEKQDRRVVVSVEIRIDGDDFESFIGFGARVKAALDAGGVKNDGVATSGWKTWESVVREASAAEEIDDDEDYDEAAWLVEKMPEVKS